MKKNLLIVALLSLCCISFTARAQSGDTEFIKHADECLTVMEQAALKMKVKGVAVLAFIPDNKSISWISKMRVVGTMSNESSNYLAVAYSKMGEMAETFKDSGSGVREPKTGEFGWQGGTIKKVKAGYILAAFSGASGEQDFEIAGIGLDKLKSFF
jgi:hypothetical protein